MKSFLPISLILILFALVVSFAARPFTRKFVENALEGQTREAILSAGLASVDEVVYNHHFLKLPASTDFETKTKIAKLIDSDIPGAYVPQPKPPAEVQITRTTDGLLVLSGNVPTTIIKKRCVDLAKAENAQIDNQIAVNADIVDPQWNDSVYKFAQYFLDTKGSQFIGIKEKTLTLRGQVLSPAIASELNEMAQNAVSSDTILRDELSVRPPLNRILPFSLVKTDVDKFVLTGKAPDMDAKDHFGRVIKESVKDEFVTIDNQLKIDPTVYPNGTLPKAVGMFVGRSSSIPGVTHLIANPKNFTLRGEVKDAEVKTQMGKLAVTAVGEKLQVFNQLTIQSIDPDPIEVGFTLAEPKSTEFPPVQAEPVVAPAPEAVEVKVEEPKPEVVEVITPEIDSVTEQVTTTFKDNAIYFHTNSAQLTSWGYQQAYQISEAIKTSGLEPKLVVGGYADNRGDAEFNKNLSLQRANAVKNQLVSLGIPETQMTLQYFGEDTSNYDEENLWKSRRVELSFETNQ